jgi:hypothetical protein
MDDNKFVRASDPNDPERCTVAGANGQCPYLREKGKPYCPRHITGGFTDGHGSLERLVGGNYKLKKEFAGRINELTTSDKIKNLREEIALMRMVLETIINRCDDAYDLALAADQLSKLVDQINKLVVSCHKIEEATGMLLDKTVVINIGTIVVDILSKYVPDKSILDKVGGQIYEAITTSAGREIA